MSLHVVLVLFAVVSTGLSLAGIVYVLFLSIVGVASVDSGEKTTRVQSPTTRFLVLIPAHNEEHGIRPTLESVSSQDYPAALRRAIVIADNCQDSTANVVRQAGFECWERNDSKAKGKGQALRWALDRLESESFGALVFVDADTRLCPGFLEALDREIQAGASAIQCRYEFDLADSSYFSLLTVASKRAENNLYWNPRERLGFMGFIVGNGFCLRREIVERVPWSAYSIVEDVEYSVQLALQGVAVRYLGSACVISRATRRVADAFPQRLRWASGTFQVITACVPRLLRASLARRSFRLAEMAIALLLTSRLLLLYLLGVGAACSLILGTNGVGLEVRVAVVGAIVLLAGYAGMVLRQIPDVSGGRLRAIVTLPFYVCWMMLVHAGALLGLRRNVWVGTKR